MTKLGLVIAFISLTSLGGCVTTLPIEEWNLARSAFDSAKEADASRYVPAIWFNAEQSYREGVKAYRDRRYGSAKNLFIESKELCEQAENQARLAKYQSGEVVP